LPESTVAIMLEHLVEAGILHRLETESGAVALARPPEQISADQLIEIGFRMVDEGGTDDRPALLDHLRDAQKNLARKATLASLAG
jgi:DNA-binding IscR family transcriptional regulator